MSHGVLPFRLSESLGACRTARTRGSAPGLGRCRLGIRKSANCFDCVAAGALPPSGEPYTTAPLVSQGDHKPGPLRTTLAARPFRLRARDGTPSRVSRLSIV